MSVHPKDWAEAHVNGAAIREVADRVRDDRGDASDVSEPDMSILKRNRLAASPFPLEVLGPAGPWVEATAASKSAPIDYVALGLLVTAAGLIGPKRRVSPWEGWEEPSILWGALIGPPSMHNSSSRPIKGCGTAHRAAGQRGLEREASKVREPREDRRGAKGGLGATSI